MPYFYASVLEARFRVLQADYEAWRSDAADNSGELPVYFLVQFRQLLADCCPRSVFEYMARDLLRAADFYDLVKAALAYTRLRLQHPLQDDVPTSFPSPLPPLRRSQTQPSEAPRRSFGFGFGGPDIPF